MNCALVTGASRGIGKAIALQLAKDHKLHILVNYASQAEAAQTVVDEIVASGGSAEPIRFHVEEKKEVEQALQGWTKNNQDKNISVLVNNAGITKDGLFMWMPESSWDEVIAVSLKGMFNVTQQVIRQMMNRKWGRIINITSVSGMKGVAGQTNYSAAKAGLVGATKALAQEVARMNITVNAIAPGFIKTEMTEEIQNESYIKLIPTGRIGEPEEVAHLVSFIASEKSAYLTGEVINLNGGLYS